MSTAGKGTDFRRWNSTSGAWESVAEVKDLGGPNKSKTAIDASHFQSADDYREFISGMKDGGVVTFTMNFTRDGYEAMDTDFEADALGNYEIVLPDTDQTSIEFEAVVTELPLTVPLDDNIESDVSMQVSGKPVINSGSAPSLA